MKRSAFLIPLSLVLLHSPASGQQPEPILAPSGADFVAYAEKLIETTRREKPDLASRADELYKRLPAIVDQLEREARAAGSKADNPGMETDTPQLEAQMERWIAEKGAHIDTEMRFATGRLKIVRQAMQPVVILIEERQRKQQIIASVIILIKDLLDARDGSPEEPDADRNKSDRVGPSASNRGDLLPVASGTAALSMD